MGVLRKMGSFVRWRLVPTRYLTLLVGLRWSRVVRPAPARLAVTRAVQDQGFATGPALGAGVLSAIQALYRPRVNGVKPRATGHPFENLFTADDINADNPVFRYAFSPAVLDVAVDYFGGKPLLDSIQVLYSYPTEGEQRESQYWHLDYGDTKSFHCVAYLNDVLTPTDGPFVFVDKQVTNQVGRSVVVRRIPDDRFDAERKTGEIRSFFGQAGSAVFVDPSACYHYGSRCKTPRLAIFVTFSSWFPFAQPVPLVRGNAQRIWAAARQVRPDLSDTFLASLLQVDTPQANTP